MINSRLYSIISSSINLGFFKTLTILFKISLFKLGVLNNISIKKYGKFFIRKNTTDLPVFRQVFMDLEYSYSYKTKNVTTIVDVGANIGMFTRFIRERYPNSNIFCIEPEPSNFEQLKINVKEDDKTFLINKAIWTDNLGVNMAIDDKYGEWGARVSSTKNELTKVGSITMNDLVKDYNLKNIDILKIDVEGAEKFIFEKNLSWMNKVNTLIIELHDFMEAGSSNSFFEALSNMKPYTFSIKGENIIIQRTKL